MSKIKKLFDYKIILLAHIFLQTIYCEISVKVFKYTNLMFCSTKHKKKLKTFIFYI